MTLKRLLDVTTATVGVAVLAPVFLVVSIAVRVSLGGPVVFRQQRPGLHGRLFTLLKFRSMREAVDRCGVPLPDAGRLGTLGRFLRRTSLDELPELFNVLRGDMSLVGPRPLLAEYLPRYSTRQARRHEVLPGITGLAQVSGRNALSWEERFELDVRYVETRSLRLDLAILFRTIGLVLTGHGVSQSGHATAAKFKGYAARPPGGS